MPTQTPTMKTNNMVPIFGWRYASIVSLLLLQIAFPLDAFQSQRQIRRQQRLNTNKRNLNSESRQDFNRISSRNRLNLQGRNKHQNFHAHDNHQAIERSHTIQRDYAPIEEDADDIDDNSIFGSTADPSKNSRKVIRVSSQIELPFSAEVAYEAYSNLPRQSSWSPWLESVVLLNNDDKAKTHNKPAAVESRWTSRVLGIRYSWTARSVRADRPHTIQWRSVTGLPNEGIVRFHRSEGGSFEEGPTLMTLKMAFVTPRAIAAIVRRSEKVRKFVEETVITQSLNDFRDTVLEHDVALSNKIAVKSTISESETSVLAKA